MIGYGTLMWYRVSIHWVIVIIGMHMEDYMWSTTYCNLKREGPENTAHWLPSTNPGVHVLLSHSHTTQTSKNTAHNLPTDSFRQASRDRRHANIFFLHNNRTRFRWIHLLPYTFTQIPARETLLLHYRLCTFPKAQACFSSEMFTKAPDS